MKRFRNFLALVALAVFAAFTYTVDLIADTVHVAVTAVRHTLTRGLSLFATKPATTVIERQPAQYREYRQRQDRRETPVITASWRMCPSG